MLKMILRIFIGLATITILGSTVLYFYNQKHTYFNAADEIGNTAGNLYNGGLFCEQDGKIYFSNDYSEGSLFVMTSLCNNITKLSTAKAVYINADENYLYYVSANDTKVNIKDPFLTFNNSGVYRINQNGSNLKVITGDPSAYIYLKGNDLYFDKYTTERNFGLYRYQIDGTGERLLLQDGVIPASVEEAAFIYTGNTNDDNSINALDLSSYTSHIRYEGSYLYPIISGDYIYYLDTSDNNHLYRMNIDGSEPTVVVDKRCSTYNITNNGLFLFYQVDNNKSNSLNRINLETMASDLLKKGDYKQINVTEHFVFFRDCDNTNTYFIASAGGAIINTLDTLLTAE